MFTKRMHRKLGFSFVKLVNRLVDGSFQQQTFAEDSGIELEYLSVHTRESGEPLQRLGNQSRS